MFKVQVVYSKGSGKLNEDQFLAKGNLFAVFDGMSSLINSATKGGKTGGMLASEIAKSIFSKNDRPLGKLAEKANNAILARMLEEHVDTGKKEARWAACAAAVRLREGEAEFFGVGDCLILVVFKNGSYKLATEYLDHDMETLIKWKNLTYGMVEDIWTKLKPQIDKVRRGANIKYGCLNGEKEASKFFKTGKFSLEGVKSIILFTDGLLIPKESPEEPEDWKTFVKTYEEFGLNGLLNYVRSLEESDKKCWKYPRFKLHDDVAAIGIDF